MKKAGHVEAWLGKSFLDHVIRRFNASSAGLNKPQGLDVR
jgi:hypothetical protein